MGNHLIPMRSALIDKLFPGCYDKGGAVVITVGGWLRFPKGGVHMPITLTFHIREWTVTIQVKSRNRHSAK